MIDMMVKAGKAKVNKPGFIRTVMRTENRMIKEVDGIH
jgi:hypothetical protein